jgi:hypothetical protein
VSDSAKPGRGSKAQEATVPAQDSKPEAATSAAPEPPAPDPIDAANLDEAFVKALEADFIAYGKNAIAAMRVDRPTDYMKIVAALRAKDAGGPADPFRAMSDAELDRCIVERAERAGYEIRPAAPDRPDGAAPDDGAEADWGSRG